MLKDSVASESVLINRAKVIVFFMSLMGFLHRDKALLLTGAIFKSTVPDESDEERREIERCASFQSCMVAIIFC